MKLTPLLVRTLTHALIKRHYETVIPNFKKLAKLGLKEREASLRW
jgi:hypothetical protein